MSEVTSLYGTLASSASIFLGIIAALLVNRIISTESERSQLTQRVGQINSERKSISGRLDEIDDRLEALFDNQHKNEIRKRANEDLDEFIDTVGGLDLDTGDRSLFFEVRDEFQAFVNQDRWSEYYYTDVLQSRFPEILSEIGIDDSTEVSTLEWEIRKLREEIRKGNSTQVFDRRIADRRSLNRRLTELSSLYDWISSRFESLDVSQYQHSLWILALSLFFSAIVPVFFFSAHVVGPIIKDSPTLAAIETPLVVVSWVFGLSIVVRYLWTEIQDDGGEELDHLHPVEVNTFAEALPNIVEIPDDVPPNEREQYVRDQVSSPETVRYINESENEIENQ